MQKPKANAFVFGFCIITVSRRKEQAMTIGDRIKTLRQIQGITQAQLGMACGYDSYASAARVVQQWEANRWQPSVKQLWPLCHCLGVTLDTLVPDPCKDSITNEQADLIQQMTGKPLELLYIEDQVG